MLHARSHGGLNLQPAVHSRYLLDQPLRERLLSRAPNREDLQAVVLAGIIAVLWREDSPNPVPILGLRKDDFVRLATRYLGPSGEMIAARSVPGASHPADGRQREFGDLLRLFLDHSTVVSEDTEWLARAIATACLGNNHLWQDLGVPSRRVVSQLLVDYFTSLAQRNTSDMRWKKFFYKQLCERADIKLCKAPSCAECVDYDLCFGPEDGAAHASSENSAGPSIALIMSPSQLL